MARLDRLSAAARHAREAIATATSATAQKEYIEGLRKYFRGLLSHRELALIVRSALGPHTAIHNRFIRAIFTSAEHQALLEEYGPGYKDKEPAKREAPRPPPEQQPGQKPITGAPPSQPMVRVPLVATRTLGGELLLWPASVLVPLSACWLARAGSAHSRQTSENDVEWCVRDALQPRAQRLLSNR